MIAAVALFLAQASAQPLPVGESGAVVELFRAACTRGQLRLSNGARTIKEKDLPHYANVLNSWTKWTNQTFVEFKYPATTYVVLADLQNPQPKSIARRCMVVSRKLTQRDAVYALVESTPDVEPRQTWVPAMHLPEWTIDLPKEGYRKSLYFGRDGTTYLELGTYKSALN
jgi:hypothetical protein